MHNSFDFPPIEALVAMLAAAKLGSFSAAAEELGVTHGAVSRRIRAVEIWLNHPVFERQARGVCLTPIGHHFAKHVETALAGISAVAVNLRAERRIADVRVSVLPSFARLWLMQRISALQGPQLDLLIQVKAEHRIARLEKGEVDIAIRYGTGPWPGVEARPWLRERVFAVAAPKLARKLARRGVADIMSMPLLLDTDAELWKVWCAQAQIRFQPQAGEYQYDDYDLLLSAAEAGAGVALARWPLAANAIDEGRLTRLAGPEFDNPKSHFIVTRPGESRLAVLRLVDRLISQATSKG
ncbi:MAG: LysR substrate-binding domain-containing protein [Pseudomonadota bacterium]